MRKLLYLLCITIITSTVLSGCIRTRSDAPTSSSPAVTSSPTGTSTPETDSEIPEATAEPDDETNGNSSSDERAEISKMIKDAQELIDEDLIDDANMLIRDLLTRELTEKERAQVEALQSKEVKISD